MQQYGARNLLYRAHSTSVDFVRHIILCKEDLGTLTPVLTRTCETKNRTELFRYLLDLIRPRRAVALLQTNPLPPSRPRTPEKSTARRQVQLYPHGRAYRQPPLFWVGVISACVFRHKKLLQLNRRRLFVTVSRAPTEQGSCRAVNTLHFAMCS